MSDPKIYCPKCKWMPDAFSLWACLPVCGNEWNTFSTGGVCPKCGESFEQTQCLKCWQFSPHKDWYHSPQGGDKGAEHDDEKQSPAKASA
jgi:predicted amidophosphoribosyltransferase